MQTQHAQKLKIFLDTNVLIQAPLYHIDITAELMRLLHVPYEVIILDIVRAELSGLSKGKSKDAQSARIGLALADHLIAQKKAILLDTAVLQAELRHIEKHLNADLVIENMVSGGNCVVATQDQELRQKIAKIGAKTLVMRQKSHMELI